VEIGAGTKLDPTVRFRSDDRVAVAPLRACPLSGTVASDVTKRFCSSGRQPHKPIAPNSPAQNLGRQSTDDPLQFL
jgi:hypothetical protein